MASARGEIAHALQPVPEDGIAGQQVGILVDLLREGMDECLHAVEKVQRRLHREAADADVAGHHPLSGYRLKDAQNLFALAEGVEEDGERANVHGVGAQPDQVRVEAAQFGQQHAQPLCLLGNLKSEQLLDGQA